MSAAPIYLLRDGEVDGPHEDREIIELLDDREIDPDMLASIEGMREWRSVKETLVWSHGALLVGFRDEVWKVVEEISHSKADGRAAGSELANLSGRQFDGEVIESFGTILQVNSGLLMKHRLYRKQHDAWTQGAADLWPAFDLTSFGQQLFPRDWSAAWGEAGGKVVAGKMVALKNDPIWLALSDFGFPFPPLTMDWLMSMEAMPADEASEFGIEWHRDSMDFTAVRDFDLVGIPK